jgi:hypothetical protein
MVCVFLALGPSSANNEIGPTAVPFFAQGRYSTPSQQKEHPLQRPVSDAGLVAGVTLFLCAR